MQRIAIADIQTMEKQYRANFINSVTGFKSANLIGTRNSKGQENLSIVSSIVHLGSDPALVGMVVRPPLVPRHSYDNIIATRYYTINHVSRELYRRAHHTSARYPKEQSEFEAAGIRPTYRNGFWAPYVEEARIAIGCALDQTLQIEANGTVFVVGRIAEIWLAHGLQDEDGYLDIEKAETIAISGLDAYHQTSRLERLPYAKPKGMPDNM